MNYLTIFKRGTVYLALGKARLAVADLSRVLELKPDFSAARYARYMYDYRFIINKLFIFRIQIGSVYMKLGEYDTAEAEFVHVVRYIL